MGDRPFCLLQGRIHGNETWCASIYGSVSPIPRHVFTHWRAAGFHLPHEKTIKEYTRWNSEAPGFNDDVLRQLAISYEERHSYHARAGYLAFDAMSVQEEVVLNRRTCDIEGFQNVGNLVSYTNKLFAPPEDDAIKAIQLAKQCLQLVFISMDGLHKVPIGYFLVESENATLIVEMLHAAIMRLMIINIHTVAFIGDGSGPNRSTFEQLTSVAPQTVLAGSNWNDGPVRSRPSAGEALGPGALVVVRPVRRDVGHRGQGRVHRPGNAHDGPFF